jgi:glutathione synthase/RimK-type ligase-like ATP-grasp enzyme
MSVTIPLLTQACKNLELPYEFLDKNKVVLKVSFLDKSHLFIANNLGLNNEVVEKICRDKSYTYQLLKDIVSIPETDTYIDPKAPEIYRGFSKFRTQCAVVSDILNKDLESIILKPNSKSMGVNVFDCNTEVSVKKAVASIWDKKSYYYDHILLAQEKITIQKEYRVVVFNGKVELVYQKDNQLVFTNSIPKYIGNVSPLHYEGAKAVLLSVKNKKDKKIISDLQSFLSPIFKNIDLKYAGIDVVLDSNNKYQLLELNSKPGYSFFVRDNGSDEVISFFEKVLKTLAFESSE